MRISDEGIAEALIEGRVAMRKDGRLAFLAFLDCDRHLRTAIVPWEDYDDPDCRMLVVSSYEVSVEDMASDDWEISDVRASSMDFRRLT